MLTHIKKFFETCLKAKCHLHLVIIFNSNNVSNWRHYVELLNWLYGMFIKYSLTIIAKPHESSCLHITTSNNIWASIDLVIALLGALQRGCLRPELSIYIYICSRKWKVRLRVEVQADVTLLTLLNCLMSLLIVVYWNIFSC